MKAREVRGRPFGWLMVITLMMWLAGCTSTPSQDSRYALSQDRAPSGEFDVSGLADAVPRYEPRRTAGNRSPYTVWGKQYTVMASADGYLEQGVASWYGEKFHGHKTSNGEVFNMYAMSAAHKSLPIPSYARVTNLDNGRAVIVRVNDRGPFHGDRLIDLSYAAAKKLDYHNRGTARVEVAAITVTPDGAVSIAGEGTVSTPSAGPAPAVTPALPPGNALFVQLGSFSNRDPAQRLADRAVALVGPQVRVRSVETDAGRFHRVQVGPFQDSDVALRTRQQLADRGFVDSILLTDTR